MVWSRSMDPSPTFTWWRVRLESLVLKAVLKGLTGIQRKHQWPGAIEPKVRIWFYCNWGAFVGAMCWKNWLCRKVWEKVRIHRKLLLEDYLESIVDRNNEQGLRMMKAWPTSTLYGNRVIYTWLFWKYTCIQQPECETDAIKSCFLQHFFYLSHHLIFMSINVFFHDGNNI